MGVLIINSGDPAWTIPAGGTSITSVVGTTGVDTVNVTSGAKVSFDSSFNAGTDKIYIQGDSTSYKVSNSGATVTLTDATGNTIVVPAGAVGQTLVFGDGSAILKIDGTTLKLGTQTVTTTATAVATTAVTAGSTTSDSQFGTTTGTPTFTVEAGAASVTEGGSATFTVKLANPPATGTATVNYTLTGTGTAVLGTDTGTATPGNSGTLTFTAGGATTQTITVPVTFDSTTETGEGLKLEIASPSTGAALGTTTSVTTAIADPATPTFTITGKDSAGNNITAGTPTQEGKNITFTVTPSGIVDKDTTLTVNMTGAGSATITNASSADFTSAQTITFKAGETAARTAQITVVDDTTTEGIEAYKAQLLSGTTEVTSISGLITDPITTVTLSQSATSGSINEGQSVTYTVTADRAAPTGGIVIPYTLGSGTGYATLTTDYTGSSALTGTITIPAGSTTGTLILNAVEDNTTEATAEKVDITLGTPTTQNVVLGNTVKQETTIADTSQGLAAGTIALSASGTSVNEGSAITYTVTLGTAAPTGGLNVPYKLEGTATTGTDYTYTGGTATTGNITVAAGATTGTLILTTVADNKTEGAETVINTITAPTNYSLVTGKNTTTTTINDTSVAVAGTTYTLTSGIDVISGTASDDIIIGDNTGANKQLSTADQIAGGNGNDTLKVYIAAADTTTGVPTLTSIETFYVNGGAVTALTAPTGTTALSIDAPVVNTAATYTLAGQALTLANHTITANTTTTVASTTDTTENITLNGMTNDGVGGVNTLDLSGANVSSATLTTSTAASKITLTNTGTALATLTINGDKDLTLVESLTALKTINASGATGAVSVDTSGLASDVLMSFTGGSGNDTLIFKAAQMLATDTVNGGTGTDMVIINDTTPVYAALNGYTSIEKLGVNTTGATVDVSLLTSIRSFQVGTGNLTETFNNSTNTSAYTILNAGNTGTVTISNAVGQNTTTAILYNPLAVVKTLVNLTVSGETTVNLMSTGVAGSAGNIITTLANADNSSIVITGDKALKITNGLAGTTTGSSVDASAFTSVLTVTGSGKNDIIKGGTGDDVITGAVGADTLTGGSGADKFYLTTGLAADLFVGSLATTAGMDKITDFVAGTDKIGLVNGTTAVTSVTITAVTVATAADVATLLTAIGTSVPLSTAPASQVGLITVSGGAMAGTYLLINDTANVAAATDSLINITGVTGTVTSGDFVFA